MKSIQNQYNQLIEGNLSKANFMRNIRMTFPQYITNVTNFDDSVKILKNKGILSENHNCNPVEVDLGLKVEVAKHDGDVEKAKKTVYANLKKNSSYYSQLALSGHSVEPEKIKVKKAKKSSDVDTENGMKKVKEIVKESQEETNEELDTKKVYGGTGQNQGDTGSSLQFTVTENTPEYFEIDFTLTPNSKYRQAGAGSRSPREKEYGYAKISKKDFNGQITVKGENFNIGKDFITNNLQENLDETGLNLAPNEEPNAAVKQAAQFIDLNNQLKQFSGDITLQNHDEDAVLKYGYWEKLPEGVAEKLSIQFDIEEDVDEDEDTGIKIAYILTPKPSQFRTGERDLGAAFEKFKATLETIVREVLEEENQLNEALNKDIKLFGGDLDKRFKEAGFDTLVTMQIATPQQLDIVQKNPNAVLFEVYQTPETQMLTVHVNPKMVSKAESIINKFQFSDYNGPILKRGWTAKQVTGAINPGDIYKQDDYKSKGLWYFYRLAKVNTTVKTSSTSVVQPGQTNL
jgi:hypothetical protein